jgi:hypothetical protein
MQQWCRFPAIKGKTGENAAKFVRMVGFFTMTMFLLTAPFPFKRFWPKRIFLWYPTLQTHLILPLVIFFSSLNKNEAKRTKI